MKIHGKEREFLFSVGAYSEIAKLCPEGNMKEIAKLFEGKTENEIMHNVAVLGVVMNKQAELRNKYEGKEYNEPLTVEELQTLTPDEYKEFQAVVLRAFHRDKAVTVETEVEKKTETPIELN